MFLKREKLGGLEVEKSVCVRQLPLAYIHCVAFTRKPSASQIFIHLPMPPDFLVKEHISIKETTYVIIFTKCNYYKI